MFCLLSEGHQFTQIEDKAALTYALLWTDTKVKVRCSSSLYIASQTKAFTKRYNFFF